MQQKLKEIADLKNIDQENARRLESCLDSQFVSCPIRYFRARKAIFIAGASEPLSIRISGFGQPFLAKELICCNTDNPEELEVSVEYCDLFFQSAKDPDILYLNEGMTSISGPKRSELDRELDQPAQLLKALPRRDPDVVQIDGRVFRQTGTVCIRSAFYLVILER